MTNRNYISGLACWWLLTVEPGSLLLYPRTRGYRMFIGCKQKKYFRLPQKSWIQKVDLHSFLSVQVCFGRHIHVSHSSCRFSLIFHLSWSSLLLFWLTNMKIIMLHTPKIVLSIPIFVSAYTIYCGPCKSYSQLTALKTAFFFSCLFKGNWLLNKETKALSQKLTDFNILQC